MESTRHFVLEHERHKMKTLQRPLTRNAAMMYCIRRLLVVTFLLLSASDARRVVAEPSHPYRRVEIRVEDFSFSKGSEQQQQEQQVVIEARDIKGSELKPWPSDDDLHVITWEMTDETDKKVWSTSEMEPVKKSPSATAAVVEKEDDEVIEVADIAAKAAVVEEKDDAAIKRYTAYRTAMWWWSDEKTELSAQEQAAVLVVVVVILLVIGLVLAVLWNLAWFAWRFYRERQTLYKLFSEQNPVVLEQELRKFPVDLLSLCIKHIACVRLRHLQVVSDARDLTKKLETVEFREIEMELVNMPLHATSRKEMTFAEILTNVEEITCRAEQVAVEMMQLVIPPRWKNYVDERSWLKVHDESLQSLHLENARVQQLAEKISELLVAKINSNEAIPKPVFLLLLASLRQNSGTLPQNCANAKVTTSELDAFARCWSGSMTMSGSVGNLGGSKNKDEFSFLLKAYDEVAEQQKVRQELLGAIESFQPTNEPEYEQLLLLENADSASSNQITRQTKQVGTAKAANSGATAASMRRLERWVDEAEMMEMTYVEEVENAQFMLEDARRDSFCAAVVSNDGKGLDSVQTLATNFVALGAKREDAILKAGEILANRSNMMLLVNSLRGMFDQLRKRDIMKMNERRNRDRAKAQDKRNRVAQKLQNKQQLIVEKIERTREAQRQKEEEARLQRRKEELKQFNAQNARKRALFVWAITKTDVFVVLVIMAVVFFENLREVAFVKPLCQPDEDHWWTVSWWTPASLQVFSCEVTYGLKILGILLVFGVIFFAAAQLNLVAVILPVLGAIGLYYLRDEWMNMLFRLPLLLVIYGYNSAILYLFNRFEDRSNDDHVVKEVDKDIVVNPTKRRRMLLYVVFPLSSFLLTVLTGVGIACDAPEECTASAYTASTSVLAGLWEYARGAYRI
ncbi:hypothetical protein KXD40_004228 [Peronospora effusa]|uniref:Transmembrane protein n=1 Tax=Peronospora effusa TaxID=542832 RepID=A0A3M6VE81_9STRA|nr:hypothetical protein DD238_007937 [Peronospora effusa]RQM12038.1 hypothetical protein DD237_008084 [Peronospora effusa]UIZ28055.1 hypothetical protein KXD40_004228 [Peronospora effusa]